MSRLLLSLLLLTASARAEEPGPLAAEPVERAEPTPPGGPAEPMAPTRDLFPPVAHEDIASVERWAIWLGAGMTIALLDDTPLGDAIREAGYTFDVNGPALSLSIERDVLDWLIVGGTLDLRWVDGERDNPELSGDLLPAVDMSLWRVGAGAYAQATLCLEYNGCRFEGLYFGALLGASAGPTLWTLRDVTEVGAFVRFDIALTWYFRADAFLIAMRLGHALLWQSEMGPNALGHGFEWTPTVELRTGWRW